MRTTLYFTGFWHYFIQVVKFLLTIATVLQEHCVLVQVKVVPWLPHIHVVTKTKYGNRTKILFWILVGNIHFGAPKPRKSGIRKCPYSAQASKTLNSLWPYSHQTMILDQTFRKTKLYFSQKKLSKNNFFFFFRILTPKMLIKLVS